MKRKPAKMLLPCLIFSVLLCAAGFTGCSEKPSAGSGPSSAIQPKASSQQVSSFHPKTIAFSDAYDKANVTIEKVKITYELDELGKSFETTDQKKIQALFDRLDAQTLIYKGEDRILGWSYNIDCTCKGIPGYFSYTSGHGFHAFEGYSGKLPTGLYESEDRDSDSKILRDFYNELSKGK